jgi:HPt (histidine-containing phosphotransfer) domain-containing protein
MRQAFEDGDDKAMAAAAHGLKSMSLNIGASKLAASLRSLETAKSTRESLVEFTITEQRYLELMQTLAVDQS